MDRSKFAHMRFEPSGQTNDADIRIAKSIVDYIFRWMAAKFLSPEAQFRAGVNNREEFVSSPEQLPLDVAAAAGVSRGTVNRVLVTTRGSAVPASRPASPSCSWWWLSPIRSAEPWQVEVAMHLMLRFDRRLVT